MPTALPAVRLLTCSGRLPTVVVALVTTIRPGVLGADGVGKLYGVGYPSIGLGRPP